MKISDSLFMALNEIKKNNPLDDSLWVINRASILRSKEIQTLLNWSDKINWVWVTDNFQEPYWIMMYIVDRIDRSVFLHENPYGSYSIDDVLRYNATLWNISIDKLAQQLRESHLIFMKSLNLNNALPLIQTINQNANIVFDYWAEYEPKILQSLKSINNIVLWAIDIEKINEYLLSKWININSEELSRLNDIVNKWWIGRDLALVHFINYYWILWDFNKSIELLYNSIGSKALNLISNK